MTSRYRSKRRALKLAHKSRRNFLITLFLITLLLYVTISWILPILVNGVGFMKNAISPAKKIKQTLEDPSLAPPILNIPYEATNTAQVNLNGYATSNARVALYLDDKKIDIQETVEDGIFVFKNVQLVLGTNNIYAKSIDESNRESLSSKNFKIIYDNDKPKLEIKEPEDNKKIQGGDKKIKISGSTEPSNQVFINDSQMIVDKDGNFSSDQSLNDGENNFDIKAIDAASNFIEVSRKVVYQP